MRRRDAFLGLCCAAACATTRSAAWGATIADTVEVAPGLHVRRGLDADATRDNEDAIANIGFVIGHDAVAVFDAGGSLHDGRSLRARIRAVTDKPVRYVVLSHVHPDHIFGAAAFAADAPVFVGHAALPAALQARGAFYRTELRAVLGADPGEVILPDRLVTSRDRIDLGGRVLELRAHPVAHTDCDLSVLDTATRTFLAGDLLFVNRVPALDGSLDGWIALLEALQDIPAGQAVPGHGPVCVKWPAASADELRYLRVLRRDVAALIARGADIEEAPQAAREERARWTLFDDYNGRNATEAFKELEWN